MFLTVEFEFFVARCILSRKAVRQYPKIIHTSFGYVAPDTVKIHEAVDVGNLILSKMDGIVVEGEYKWSKTDCVVQMPTKLRIGASKDGGNQNRAFDTNFAVQRIMINTQSLPEVFKYEFSDYHRSLFTNGQMRDPG